MIKRAVSKWSYAKKNLERVLRLPDDFPEKDEIVKMWIEEVCIENMTNNMNVNRFTLKKLKVKNAYNMDSTKTNRRSKRSME